jgi:MoaA/NifB/PqqE/SkfB family radical SAM enzyme
MKSHKEAKGYILSKDKRPTRRGVIWIGQTCNLSCYFCYFSKKIADKKHPEHPFFDLDKAKEICKRLRYEYNLNSIDIQGGEATIYSEIFELLDFCNQIGLKPSIITNAIALNNYKYCKKFKTHNVYDFLVSLQGIGETYDQVVGMKGGYTKQLGALKNLEELGVPYRVNAVMTMEIIKDIEELGELILNSSARVVNFIYYNNSGDQLGQRDKAKIPLYEVLAKKLSPIIDKLEADNREVNLRFFPFCSVEEKYRKNIQNSKQKIYDLHEWEPSSRLWIDRAAQRRAAEDTELRPNEGMSLVRKKISKGSVVSALKNFTKKNYSYSSCFSYQKQIDANLENYSPSIDNIDEFSKIEHFYFEQSEVFNDKRHHEKCESCDIKSICDGLHSDFLDQYGAVAVQPVKTGFSVADPKYYLKDQLKVVENEEVSWFFDEK